MPRSASVAIEPAPKDERAPAPAAEERAEATSSARLRALVGAHEERVYRAAYRVLGEREEALDAAQEAFLALHRRGPDAVPRDAAGPWLARVAINWALDRLRARKRWLRAAPALAEQARAGARAAEDRPALDPDERDRVLRRLAALAPRQREALTLRLWEGLTFAEVARAMGIAEGAAKVHFRRGLAALKDALGARAGPDDGS